MEQFTQEMLKRLDALASKLGMAASGIWGFYIRQARVEGVTDLFIAAVCLTIGLLLNHARKKLWTDPGDRDFCGTAALWVGAGSLGCLALTFVFLHAAFTELYNPGYWAFQTIVEQLKGQ